MKHTLICVVFIIACGDDSSAMMDTGPGDSGPGMDAGTDSAVEGETFVAELLYEDPDGAPLEGVKIATESDLERVEGITDAAGRATVSIRYTNDRFHTISALEGYTIIANAAATTTGYEEGLVDGVFPITLNPLTTDSDTFSLRFGASGVPDGGRWCAGYAGWAVQCLAAGERIDFNPSVSQLDNFIHDRVTAFAYNPDGSLYDFVEADYVIDGNDRSVTVDFDGVLPAPTETRSLTLMLPEDAMSPFNTEELDPEWTGWVAVAGDDDVNLIQGAPENIQILDDRVTLTLSIFAPASGEVIWALAPYANFRDPIRTFRWFSAAPTEDTLSFLDVPRITSGNGWDGAFEWTEPADDVDRYFVNWFNNAGRLVISAGTDEPSYQLIELPAAYDRDVSFPFPDAPGTVQVGAVRGDTPMADDEGVTNFRIDGEAATGARQAITW